MGVCVCVCEEGVEGGGRWLVCLGWRRSKRRTRGEEEKDVSQR